MLCYRVALLNNRTALTNTEHRGRVVNTPDFIRTQSSPRWRMEPRSLHPRAFPYTVYTELLRASLTCTMLRMTTSLRSAVSSYLDVFGFETMGEGTESQSYVTGTQTQISVTVTQLRVAFLGVGRPGSFNPRKYIHQANRCTDEPVACSVGC